MSRHGGDEAAFAGADGAKLAEALDELATSEAAAALVVDASDYVELFAAVLADRVVRPPPRPGARVRILGPLEARLTDSDRVVLGGLVEGTWPPESRTDAWLSRPMRQQLGLDLPERAYRPDGPRLRATARRARSDPEPRRQDRRHADRAVALRPAARRRRRRRGGRRRSIAASVYLAWARALDRPEKVVPAPQPAPKPPRAARPKRLSVTEIEDWLRDPYTIYAKYILRLAPLDAVDMPPGAAERGTIIHDAIGDFTQRYANDLPADPAARSHRARQAALRRARGFSGSARLLVAAIRAHCALVRRLGGRLRRPDITAIAAEIRGEIDIPLKDGVFKLARHADRIERARRSAAMSFSTTRPDRRGPKSRCARGLRRSSRSKPRSCARADSRTSPAGARSAQVGYVLLKGGALPGEPKLIEFEEGTTDSQADHALEKLAVLARRFDDDNEPYRSLVHPMWTTRYGDYDHLARVKEWSATGGELDDIWGSE